MPQLPGVSAPMSRWCAVVTEKPISSSVVEDRHAEADVGPVRGAAVGVVVHDDVAGRGSSRRAPRAAEDAAHVAGDRPRLQRRALRAFAELPALGVGERGAEILGLADDAGVAHPHQLVAHLDGDVLERAVDDRGGDRIDARLRGAPCRLELLVHGSLRA